MRFYRNSTTSDVNSIGKIFVVEYAYLFFFLILKARGRWILFDVIASPKYIVLFIIERFSYISSKSSIPTYIFHKKNPLF